MYYCVNVTPFSRPNGFNNPAVIARAFEEGPQRLFAKDLATNQIEVTVVSHDLAKITHRDVDGFVELDEFVEIYLFEDAWEVQAINRDGSTFAAFTGSKQECIAQWPKLIKQGYTPQRIVNVIKEI